MSFDLSKPKFRVERWREVYSPNAAMLRLLMEHEGYRVYQWGDRPGMVYPVHKHEEAQSHWIVSGALELKVGGDTYTLEAGDRDFLEAETLHSARVVSDVPVIYLVGEKIIEQPKPKRGRKKGESNSRLFLI